MKESIPISQKLLITVEEAAQYTHIGENKIRELFTERDCNFVLKKGAFSLIEKSLRNTY